jgi:hypothetical protein
MKLSFSYIPEETPRKNVCTCAITENGKHFEFYYSRQNKNMPIYSLDISETNKKIPKTGRLDLITSPLTFKVHKGV